VGPGSWAARLHAHVAETTSEHFLAMGVGVAQAWRKLVARDAAFLGIVFSDRRRDGVSLS
jgi:hypothetical protein